MNLEELYKTYNIKDIEYKKLNEDILTKLDRKQVHHLSVQKGFVIDGIDIITSTPLHLEEAIVRKSNCAIRIKNSFFHLVEFDDVKFTDALLQDTIFVNTYFNNCIFSTASLKSIQFVNCVFQNCMTINTTIEDIHFINCKGLDHFFDENESPISDKQNVFIDNRSPKELYSFLTLDLKEKTNEEVGKVANPQQKKKEGNNKMNDLNLNYHENEILDTIQSGHFYKNCTFTDVNINEQVNTDNSDFIACLFVNCIFKNKTFKNTTFDECQFNACHIIQCAFLKCSFIDAEFDKQCHISASYNKCNMLDCAFSANKENCAFIKTVLITQEDNDDNKSVDEHLKEIMLHTRKIVDYMNSKEYQQLLNPAIEEKNVIDFFNSLTDIQCMQFIAKITTQRTDRETQIESKDEDGKQII